VPVTLLLNSLNRSLGQEDAYPFALSVMALEKLRYVHDVICETRSKSTKTGPDAKSAPREASDRAAEAATQASANA
jgi:hypothetical protein